MDVSIHFQVGALYPAATDPSYVIFKPTPNQTPALRAGNLSPYQFWIPPSWKEARVANILSGNYCQPKCAGKAWLQNSNLGKVLWAPRYLYWSVSFGWHFRSVIIENIDCSKFEIKIPNGLLTAFRLFQRAPQTSA